MHPVEHYLRELHAIRASGSATPEESYYPALAELLNAVGAELEPPVRCILNPRNRGAGIPDGGLFTAEQCDRLEGEPPSGLIPARGVVEVKPIADDTWLTAEGPQVTRYWERYGLVLVTNYRDFVLVGRDATGRPRALESFRLTPSETALWQAAPRTLAREQGARLSEFLKRALTHAAPLDTPADLAWLLASYAREALARVQRADLPALASLRQALEAALGLTFEGAKGDHFFRSTLIQTLFYGIFAAWVLWHKERGNERGARFNWHEAGWYLHVPMIRGLYDQVATPTRLGPLRLDEVLDWAADALARVDRPVFFSAFDEGQAVQYFYEPFLEAYDPQLRKELGVWYTPPEIVQYQVARVDTVLREELGVADGLADPNVYVLDPCCGTGAYLVEVLRRIAETLATKDGDALLGQHVRRAATERVFGFELLPAPFVVAHLQLGLLLRNLGAPLPDDGSERVGVFLTNALTGWEPPESPKDQLAFQFPELAEERDQASHVKREAPILVVLGNPPYNAYAGVSPAEEQGLVEPYKEGLIAEWGIKKFNLDDLYVRFFGLAERRIVKLSKRGVVCFISSFSYLGDPSFVALRRRLLAGFDRIWIDCLNGDSRRTGKLTPSGEPDPSVFSTELNRAGIRVGTAIALMVRSGNGGAVVRYREFWGANKRAELLASLERARVDDAYEPVAPGSWCRYSFRPLEASAAYRSWPAVAELCEAGPWLGILENRREALISIDRRPLEERMRRYFDASWEWADLADLGYGFTTDMARFDAKKARAKVLGVSAYSEQAVRRFLARPMDLRWCYYSSVRPLWNEPRPDYAPQCWPGNLFVVTRRKGVAEPEGAPFNVASVIGNQHGLHTDAYYIPLLLRTTVRRRARTEQGALFEEEGDETRLKANLSPAARDWLKAIGIADPDADTTTAGLPWHHVLAVGYAPAYLSDNAAGIKHDWPRIPLPNSADLLSASAALGQQLAALLDPETAVPGVTAGVVRDELRAIGVVTRAGGGTIRPELGELDLRANWGYAGRDGVIMPAKGRAEERDYTAAERDALVRGAAALGLSAEQTFALLGESTFDAYLNDVAWWSNLPANVWNYHIGGYQVIKKWLSYRERDLLGRAMSLDEVDYVSQMARRIAAVLLLGPTLDNNYRRVKAAAFPWPEDL